MGKCLLSTQHGDLGSIPSTCVKKPSPGDTDGGSVAELSRLPGKFKASERHYLKNQGDGLVRWLSRSKGFMGLITQARSLDPTVRELTPESCPLPLHTCALVLKGQHSCTHTYHTHTHISHTQRHHTYTIHTYHTQTHHIHITYTSHTYHHTHHTHTSHIHTHITHTHQTHSHH